MTNQEELNDEETKEEVPSLGGQMLHHWSSGINRQSREIPKSQPTTKLDYEKSYRRYLNNSMTFSRKVPQAKQVSPHTTLTTSPLLVGVCVPLFIEYLAEKQVRLKLTPAFPYCHTYQTTRLCAH